MDLEGHVRTLRGQLAAVAAASDPETRATAETLSGALEPAVRAVLLQALVEVAGEVSAAIAPGGVDVVLRGAGPELVVTRPPAPERAEEALPEHVGGTGDDTVTARTTLRLPDHLKTRVESAAALQGVSVNTWLVRAVAAALEPPRRRADRNGDRFTGWAR